MLQSMGLQRVGHDWTTELKVILITNVLKAMFPSTDRQIICTYKQEHMPLKRWLTVSSAQKQSSPHCEMDGEMDAVWQEEPLTTSSSAALRPKEQVRCVRQLTKDENSSRGMAVSTLRGNTVIRLLMMLEMPTASESSISILQPKVLAPALSGAGGTGFHPLIPKAHLCVLTSHITLLQKVKGTHWFLFPSTTNHAGELGPLPAGTPTHWWCPTGPRWSGRGSPPERPHQGRQARAGTPTAQGTAASPGPCQNPLWSFDVPVGKMS